MNKQKDLLDILKMVIEKDNIIREVFQHKLLKLIFEEFFRKRIRNISSYQS